MQSITPNPRRAAPPPTPPRGLLNRLQKQILILGLAALAATTLVAPYRWHAANVTGHLYRPMWNPPQSYPDVETVMIERHDPLTDYGVRTAEVALDTGLIALWWGAIAAVTTVAVLLAAPRRST